MLIREKQLSLFEDPAPDMLGGVPTCSMEHPKPKRAKYRVYFKNGNCRDVCGWCVKRYRHAQILSISTNLSTTRQRK